jgi:hypothetical protein
MRRCHHPSAVAAGLELKAGEHITDTESVALPLIHELTAAHQRACPYLRHNEHGCYCTSPQLPAGGDPYMACDVYSLQIWCLVEDHYTRCHFLPAGIRPEAPGS